MKINIGEYSPASFQYISITHPEEPDILVDKGGYATVKILHHPRVRGEDMDGEVTDVLFNEVNEFISRLSQDKQLKLYECYARADNLFQSLEDNFSNDTIEGVTFEKNLRSIVKDIYDIVLFDDLLFYVKGNRNLKIPMELSNEFNTEDKITQKYIARTYTLTEYMDLMALCLGLRFMIPIWAPYITLMTSSVGSVLKEYHTWRLLSRSKIFMSPPIDRLELYIRANIDAEEINVAPALHFLSLEEIPTYAIAITAVRKLSISPLSAETEKDHLMKIIHSFAVNKIKNLDGQLEKGLKAKTSTGMYEDDNSSVFCLFKMKEQMTGGELEYIKLYVANYVKTAQAIDPDIPEELVELCVQRVLSLPAWRAHDIQKGLVAWTMSPVIIGSAVPLFNRNTRLLAMGISQALLWHWDMKELAILITAKPEEFDENEFRRHEGRNKLPDDILAELEEINPYCKTRTSRSGNTNEAVKGIELFSKELGGRDWIPQAPRELVKEYNPKMTMTSPFGVSPDIRINLAKLLIKLADI